MTGPLTLRAAAVLVPGEPARDGGWVRIERGRVAAIGVRKPPGGRLVDLGDALILPGLVNAHTHLEFSGLPAPFPPSGGLPEWIARVVAWRRDRDAAPSAATARATAIARGLAESAAAGVTAVGEIATATPAAITGPRPRVRAFREAIGLSPAGADAAWRAVRGDLSRGRVHGISPHAPYTVTASLAATLVAEARRRRVPLAMHVAETAAEEELLVHGTGPMRRLLEDLGAWRPAAPPRLLPAADWIGWLARAARGLVIHGTRLPEMPAAFDRLARHRDRLAVVVCPRTALALADTLPPVGAFRAAGLRVALGTDGRSSAPDLSLLAECRTLVDRGGIAPATALAMATRDGGWALMLEDRCGRLAAGLPADLVVLRPRSAGPDPWEAAVAPDTVVEATLRGGRVIAGRIG